ncbi:MAG: amidohydrolase [Proteobacteria bacterium]|nr:amidohydrolase [Pseudomonadota bacterium]
MNKFIRSATIASVIAVLISACSKTEVPAESPGADIAFTNGRIYTVDADRTWAEAVAISGGQIVYVGSNAGIDEHVGSHTKVVDLKGRMMLPAFQDSHIHPIGGGIEASACDLNGLNDLAAYRSVIGEYAAANPDVEWITGGGWAMSVFGPGGAPSRTIIDELVPDRPVFLSSQDGHTGWANSRALEIAGINKDTPDPVDGRIDRDPQTGEAIGSLQEGAMSLVARHVPADSPATRQQGLIYAQNMLHGFGITSIQDASARRESLEAYAALERSGQLKLRVVASLWWERDRGAEQVEDLLALREEFNKGGLLRPTTVKIMMDGVMENYTAAMLEPYLIPSGSRGIPMVQPDVLDQVVPLLDKQGFQVHFHSIGDAAIRYALDAIEEASLENGQLGNRHHISHIQMWDPADIPRFQELGVVANFQPVWAYADDYVTELTIPFIGEERARWMYPIKSVQDTGAVIAFGSDWSVSTANPLPQMETAVTRKDATDDSDTAFIPEERIDLETAIVAFTINAAFVNKQEDETGSIEIGKLADLIVLDQNLFEIDPDDISEAKVLLTLFGGEAVYGDMSTL